MGKSPVGESPYHASFVSAKDGKSFVTSETSATDVDASSRSTNPRFYLHKNAETYHENLRGEYGHTARKQGNNEILVDKDHVTLEIEPHEQQPKPSAKRKRAPETFTPRKQRPPSSRV
ncbi:MAG: hypothetical protein H6728_13250 [Myxococcales bacterium]|nr:hypothetical protein [Myxococcales bacterium]MCB9644036.1 hypothetical protein [Myxococcales bacterium]